MKNTTIAFLGCLLLLSTASCNNETATIQIQNKVHNVTLSQISCGDISVASSLGPGEKSDKVVVEDKEKTWPKTFQVEFYMYANGNQVYLKTRQKYTLDIDDELLIVIADTSSVFNPMFD